MSLVTLTLYLLSWTAAPTGLGDNLISQLQDLQKQKTIQSLLENSKRAFTYGQFEQAAEMAWQALEVDFNHAQANKVYEQALQHCTPAMPVVGEDPMTWNYLAAFQPAPADFGEAEEASSGTEKKTCPCPATCPTSKQKPGCCASKCCETSPMQKALRQVIHVDFRDTPLQQVIEDLRCLSGIRIDVDVKVCPQARTPVTLKAKLITVEALLNLLGAKTATTPVTEGNCVRLVSKTNSTRRVYDVADLVVPIPHLFGMPNHMVSKGCTAQELITAILSVVSVQKGEECDITYCPKSYSLIVNGNSAVQEKTAEIIAQLRKAQEPQVTIQTYMVTISEAHTREILKKMDVVLPVCEANKQTKVSPVVLNDEQRRRFLELCQSDEISTTIQTPRLTSFNGQQCQFTIGKEVPYVKSFELYLNDQNELATRSTMATQFCGTKISFLPVISGDRRMVKLATKVLLTDAEPKTVCTPVTVLKKDNDTIHSIATPLKKPVGKSRHLESVVNLPQGKTVMLYIGAQKSSSPVPQPGLLQTLMETCHCATPTPSKTYTFVLVNAKVVNPHEEEKKFILFNEEECRPCPTECKPCTGCKTLCAPCIKTSCQEKECSDCPCESKPCTGCKTHCVPCCPKSSCQEKDCSDCPCESKCCDDWLKVIAPTKKPCSGQSLISSINQIFGIRTPEPNACGKCETSSASHCCAQTVTTTDKVCGNCPCEAKPCSGCPSTAVATENRCCAQTVITEPAKIVGTCPVAKRECASSKDCPSSANACSTTACTLTGEMPDKTLIEIYSVADLIIDVQKLFGKSGSTGTVSVPELMKRLKKTTDCRLWEIPGCTCRMAYVPNSMALVVRATPCMHKAIQAELASLRWESQPQIHAQCQLWAIPVSKIQSLQKVTGVTLPRQGTDACKCTKSITLTPNQLQALTQYCRKAKEIDCLSAPTCCTMSGQQATIQIGQECYRNNKLQSVKPDFIGTTLAITPSASADERFVSLKVRGSHERIVGSEKVCVGVLTQSRDNGWGQPKKVFVERLKTTKSEVQGNYVVSVGNNAVFAGKTFVDPNQPKLGEQALYLIVTPKVVRPCHGYFTYYESESTGGASCDLPCPCPTKPQGNLSEIFYAR